MMTVRQRGAMLRADLRWRAFGDCARVLGRLDDQASKVAVIRALAALIPLMEPERPAKHETPTVPVSA